MDRRETNLLVLEGEVFLLLLVSDVYFDGIGTFFFREGSICFFRPIAVLIINHQHMFIMRVGFYLVRNWVGYLGRYQ